MSHTERAEYLSAQANRCRRLARNVGDTVTVETLSQLAAEYEAQAGAIVSQPAQGTRAPITLPAGA